MCTSSRPGRPLYREDRDSSPPHLRCSARNGLSRAASRSPGSPASPAAPIQLASTLTATNTAAVPIKLNGSVALRPVTSHAASGCVTNAASPRPSITPVVTSSAASRMTSLTMRPRVAPSADRIAISPVRRLTLYAMIAPTRTWRGRAPASRDCRAPPPRSGSAASRTRASTASARSRLRPRGERSDCPAHRRHDQCPRIGPCPREHEREAHPIRMLQQRVVQRGALLLTDRVVLAVGDHTDDLDVDGRNASSSPVNRRRWPTRLVPLK